MTARRSNNNHIFTIDAQPLRDEHHQNFVDSVRCVVDTFTTKEEEDSANALIGSIGDKWEDGVYIKNTDMVQIAYGEYVGGDCFLKSFECYWRLRAIGAKRFKGIRSAIRGADTMKSPHYWVESKGMVFDFGGGQQKIWDRDRYYQKMRITNAQEGNDAGCFRQNESEKKLEEYSRMLFATEGVKVLVEYIKNTCWEETRNNVLEFKNSARFVNRFG